MFGKLLNHNIENNRLILNYENHTASVEIITPKIINIFTGLKYKNHFSRAIEGDKVISCNFSVVEENDHLLVETDEIKARIYNEFYVDFYDKNDNLLCEDYRGSRDPFIRRGNVSIAEEEGHKTESASENHSITVIKRMIGDESFFGLGDKTGHLNKKGYSYEMWNTDDPSPHVESHKSLYKSIPFFITLREESTFGIFFDNNFKTFFDMGKENSKYYYFGADDGNLDYYFIGGEDMKEVIGGYTYLTGTTPIPQKWVLGYQQSRWGYAPESRVREIADGFRANHIPCDVIHLDIDYMDNYKVFTWDEVKFPNHQNTIKELNSQGFKIVTIIDPGVKKEKGYHIYDEGIKNGYFATDTDDITYVNKVWPGDSVFPDYSNPIVREWWGDNQKIMLDSGVSGIWNDMNEPASFNGPLPDDVQFNNEGLGGDHREIHNLYGHLMSKSTYDGIKKHSGKRPFVITRAAYAGTQKYSTVWTGDNQSFWDHLRMAIPMLTNLGLSGISFAGTDVGGFSFDCTGELLSRWIQVGCFSPLLRNHSCIHTRDQEPWAFDDQTLEINKKYINLRYKLLPYLYDLMWEGEQSGLPVMRPLVLHYSKDKNVHNLNDQFLFGENILVAPVVEQGKTYRCVYLPEGTWYDYWTDEEITGGKVILRDAPLDLCPMYIKAGAIIPNYPSMSYVGEKEVSELILNVYPGDGNYTHYIDDGESFEYKNGRYSLLDFSIKRTSESSSLGETLKLDISNNYPINYKTIKVVYHGTASAIKEQNNCSNIKISDSSVEFVVPAENFEVTLIK